MTQPNDKQALLDVQGYEVYNRDLMRKVFPRIIREAYTIVFAENTRRRPEIRDVVAFYFLLQSYIDGKTHKDDGTLSDRFGACFLSYEAIMERLMLDRSRIKYLADILETNGIIRVADRYDGMKRFKWYFPSFCPRITDDGYLVDEFGERVVPNLAVYKQSTRPKEKRKKKPAADAA